MSVVNFEQRLRKNTPRIGKDEQTWFVRWIRRLAEHQSCSESSPLETSKSSIVGFSRMLRDGGVPARSRLQAVRAIEYYVKFVLEEERDFLAEMKVVLQRVAANDDQPDQLAHALQQADVEGVDATDLMVRTQQELRVQRYAYETEKASIGASSWQRQVWRLDLYKELCTVWC